MLTHNDNMEVPKMKEGFPMTKRSEYTKKYQATRDAIMLRPSISDGQILRAGAAAAGMSVQAFVMGVMLDYIRENGLVQMDSPADPDA